MRVGDDPRTTTNAEACDHCVIITTTGCCATCGLQVEAGGIEQVGPEACLERGEEPDWEGKGEPQGERGRVGRLLGIRRDESIVEAARRARERIEALEREVGENEHAQGLVLELKRVIRTRDAEVRGYYDDAVKARTVLEAREGESLPDAARRVMLEAEARRQWVTCQDCGAEVGTGKCPTCSFDEGATDDVGPGERLLLRELLGAEEGETLVAAAQRIQRLREGTQRDMAKLAERRDRWRDRAEAAESIGRREPIMAVAKQVVRQRNAARRQVRQLRERIAEMEARKPGRLTTFVGDVLGAAWKASRGGGA